VSGAWDSITSAVSTAVEAVWSTITSVIGKVKAWIETAADNWGVTARMSVDFRKPVEIGRPIRAEGWTTTTRRRVVDTAGRIVDARDGTILAVSPGRYVAASEARKRELALAYGFRLVPADASGSPGTVDAVEASPDAPGEHGTAP
jgi:acyl-CoA thioesterase FadM